jgi:hypothetical protein
MVDTDSGKPGKLREKNSLGKAQGMVLLRKNENFASNVPELLSN